MVKAVGVGNSPIPPLYECGRNVFPVSSRAFNRERIRGHPSAFCAYAGSLSWNPSFVTTTFTASDSGVSSTFTLDMTAPSPTPNLYSSNCGGSTRSALQSGLSYANPRHQVMPATRFDLAGRHAVVVGGTSGIGRAIALGLADAGADVAATGRRQALVDDVATEIERRHRRSLRVAADVGDPASLLALREAAVEAFGAIDILVVAAGVTKRVSTLAMDEADWQRILDINLTGTLRACQVFGAHMVARGSGRVITIASLASLVGLYEVAAYTASKAAVAGLTRALAVEWAPFGVNVNAILPGVFKTDLNRALLESARGQEFLLRTPMKRFGHLDELVGAAVFLASEAASFVTGHLLAVDGGFLASGVNQ
jgi:NAD(P)-dependent dehydrogenase (short-subunit alcohol dehydrogenase family)